jgi:hypothetical protein
LLVGLRVLEYLDVKLRSRRLEFSVLQEPHTAIPREKRVGENKSRRAPFKKNAKPFSKLPVDWPNSLDFAISITSGF